MISRLPSIKTLALYTFGTLALWGVGPLLVLFRISNQTALVVAEVLLTMLWLGFCIGIVKAIARLQLGLAGNAAGLAVCMGVILLLVVSRIGHPFSGIALMFAASFLGCVVAVLFREPNILLPVVLLSPLVDKWTVYFGPVGQVVEHTPEMLEHVSAAIPGTGVLQPIALVGAGDFLFMAMFLSAAYKLRMHPDRTAIFFYVLVTIAMLVVLTLPIFSDVGFPGLVAIATGFLAANYKCFRLSKSEKMITAVIAILAVSTLLWFYMNGR